MSQQDFKFTIWDVGHGLCIWIQTPNGHNHWIDCGANENFSPAEHVSSKHGVTAIDYLIISHPDADHLRDLPNLLKHIGTPRILARNRSMPSDEKYRSGELGYQQAFQQIDTSHVHDVAELTAPWNPVHNGGVDLISRSNTYVQGMSSNDSSVVALYQYAGWLFVCPGDIEDGGWKTLWQAKKAEFEPLIAKSKWRVLVASHHGRASGYSQAMMDSIKPQTVIVSDVAGQSETDRRFRENPVGLNLLVRPETEKRLVKYFSTKMGGRLQFEISSGGGYSLHQYEYWG
jgi:competence protein ComEC